MGPGHLNRQAPPEPPQGIYCRLIWFCLPPTSCEDDSSAPPVVRHVDFRDESVRAGFDLPAGGRLAARGKTEDWKRLGVWTGREPLSTQHPPAVAADERQYVVPAEGPSVS